MKESKKSSQKLKVSDSKQFINCTVTGTEATVKEVCSCVIENNDDYPYFLLTVEGIYTHEMLTK